MKKNIFKFMGLVFVLTILFIAINGISEVSAAKRGPVCSIAFSSNIRIGEVRNGTVTCTAVSGIAAAKLNVDDIEVESFLFRKVKITKVYNYQKLNDNTVTWNVQYKGVLLGKSTLYVKAGIVTDNEGLTNPSSVYKTVKTKLF